MKRQGTDTRIKWKVDFTVVTSFIGHTERWQWDDLVGSTLNCSDTLIFSTSELSEQVPCQHKCFARIRDLSAQMPCQHKWLDLSAQATCKHVMYPVCPLEFARFFPRRKSFISNGKSGISLEKIRPCSWKIWPGSQKFLVFPSAKQLWSCILAHSYARFYVGARTSPRPARPDPAWDPISCLPRSRPGPVPFCSLDIPLFGLAREKIWQQGKNLYKRREIT